MADKTIPYKTLKAALTSSLLALCAYTPVAQAQAQTEYSKTHPVLLVHGWEMWHVAKTDCAQKFAPLIGELKKQGFTGPFVTVTYYKDSTNCDVNLTQIDPTLTKDSRWKDIGKAFSNYVFNTYSQYGEPVDMLGHSMGGLVIRSAVQGGSEGETGFKNMLVEDAVTVATPHKGTGISRLCIHDQCKTLSPTHPDFAWLSNNKHPNGLSLIDWSVQGSTFDALVKPDSSMAMDVAPSHRKLFRGLTHNGQLVNQKAISYAVTSLGTNAQ